ncbi:MAG: sulfatase [Verrucomicrobiota bacterium]
MDRRSFLKTAALGSVSAGAVSCSQDKNRAGANAAASRNTPNLLYVFADQYRLHAMGFWKKPQFRNHLKTESDPVYTPNIDKLAEKGVVFTQATSTNPVCSPHRAMLMSGMYSSRNGVEGANCYSGRVQGLRHDVNCFTDALSQAGYETGYVGKTHWERTEPLFDDELDYVGTKARPGGTYANNYDTYIPPGLGRHSNKFWFQTFNDQHFSQYAYSNRPELIGGKKDGEMHQTERFSAEVEADAVIRFLKNKNGERSPDKPFSMFWSPNPPHNPYFSPDDCEKDIYEKHYKDMPLGEQMYRKNILPPKPTQNERFDPKKCTPVYNSLVTGVDRQLGRVLEALEETGEAENTIIIFTADHGEMLGSHGVMGKGYYEDESFLVPFIIHYPQAIKPHADDLLLGTVDIMPSTLGLMGLTDYIPETVEGVDYSHGIATGDYSKSSKPDAALYLTAGRKGVRTDQYTYVVYQDGKAEVVDQIQDPYQMNKMSPDQIPQQELAFLKQELGDCLTKAGDDWARDKKFPEHITYPAV